MSSITLKFRDGTERTYNIFQKLRGIKQNGERPTSFELHTTQMESLEAARFYDWLGRVVIPALQK